MVECLLSGVEVISLVGERPQKVQGLAFDSRKVESGSLFFATRGTQVDGHQFIDSAVASGASCVVCETLPEQCAEGVCYVQVADTTVAMGVVADNYYDHPSSKLRLVGITGTNGKTTTATLLYDLFRKLGYKVGLISTVIYRVDERSEPSTHTTPDSLRLQSLLAEMVEVGCEYCFMEVSSHALVQHRTVGLTFAGALFSNLTHDHLDYHHTFSEYIRAKKLLFDGLSAEAFALTNVDDRNGMVLLQNTKAQSYTYSVRSFADYKCRIIETLLDGMLLNLDGDELWVKFLGRFNAYNLTCVYATALLLGADRTEVLTALSALDSVDGRFEAIRSEGGLTAIVDYAHTPDALQNVLTTINEIRTPDQRLYVVVGCGGNRDATKRPEMARIAVAGCDMTILTSDNPRFEEPEQIIEQMRAGLDPTARYLAITSRAEAIKTAVALASGTDMILVAGKGHETYQDVAGAKHHFDDREQLREAFTLAKK